MDEITKNGFVTSINTGTHPLAKARQKTRLLYFAALEYIVNSCEPDAEYVNARLSQYRDFLVGKEDVMHSTAVNRSDAVKILVDDFLKPWKRKYRYLLLCDVALIIPYKVDRVAVEKAYGMIAKFLSERKQEKVNELLKILYNDDAIPSVFANAENLITQFRENRNFAAQPEIRILVTATVSAGKSTLINAIIGKTVTKTAVGPCTDNLCFIHNKPFEDDRFHLQTTTQNLNATLEDLSSVGKDAACSIASYFRTLVHQKFRVCLIDTPGVNYALNLNHGKLSRKAIVERNYDKLLYVLDARRIGEDDEIKHLKYVYENVPNEKVIFVLNKLDYADIPLSASIDFVKSDLQTIGFENPVICPLSAYFSLLLKKRKSNERLNENEQIIFDDYVRQFTKPEYDLSTYYDNPSVVDMNGSADKFWKMSFISGLFGLENILYGGTKK